MILTKEKLASMIQECMSSISLCYEFSYDQTVPEDDYSFELVFDETLFDIAKLNWLNNQYIKQQSNKNIIKISKNYIPEKWKLTENMIELVKDKLEKLDDLKDEVSIFFNSPQINPNLLIKIFPDYHNCSLILKTTIEEFDILEDFNPNEFKTIMNNIQNKAQCQSKELWQTIRFCLTGQIHGPDLASVIAILGLKECCLRFKNAIQ